MERILAFRDELIMWANAYAAQGYPVFPVNGSTKIPFVRWASEATTDPAKIADWWQTWPIAMIGIPTGARSGLVVLDVDIKDGRNGFDAIKAAGWIIPKNAIRIKTPSGGAHFYFRYDSARPIKNSASKIGDGIDIRGDGGMIIAPPSRRTIDGPDYHYIPEGQIEAGRLLW